MITAALAARPDLELVSGRDLLAPHLRNEQDAAQFFDSSGFFRTFPPQSHTDGFFAAVLARREHYVHGPT